MKITNREYYIIIDALRTLILKVEHSREVEILRDKIMKEYDRIAEKNTEKGMTSDEEEIYPSRLNSEYGGYISGGKEME